MRYLISQSNSLIALETGTDARSRDSRGLRKGNRFSDGSDGSTFRRRSLEKARDWVIKILIKTAGGILKRAERTMGSKRGRGPRKGRTALKGQVACHESTNGANRP